jgi:adenylate kinase family enzyme
MSIPGTAPDAILLMGPTGSGKTPLGDCLEANGLAGRVCMHFDFGAELRTAAATEVFPGLTQRDISFIRECLRTGDLLEKDTFHIARAVLAAFLERRAFREGYLLVLNGLPRHAAQAEDVDRLARIGLVVLLECDAPTVAERIARNSGGDRSGRLDDSPDDVRRKLSLYAERTRAVADHYRAKGVRVVTLPVTVSTTPRDAAAGLARLATECMPCH